jgi:MFS family permease
MGLAQAVWHLLLLRAAMGLFAGTMGAAAALVAATTPRRHVGNALGILQTGVFSANMIGPVLGGIAATIFGLRGSFFACAVLYAVASTFAFLFVRESSPEDAPAGATGRDTGGGLIANLRVVVAERQVLIVLVVLFALWLSTTFVRPVMPLSIDSFTGGNGLDSEHVHIELLVASFDLSREAATGVVFGVLGATSTIAAIGVGPIGQRVGYRTAIGTAAIGAALLYVPVALSNSFTAYMLAFGAVGIFQGAMVPGTNALIAALTPRGREGSAFGLAASMQSLAILVGPLGGGLTADLAGLRTVYLVLTGVLIVAAAVAFIFVREPSLDEPEEPVARVPARAH